MRRVVLAGVICGFVSAAAHAADLPDLPVLRGSFTDGLTTSQVNWEGFYIGGQGGYGSSDEKFSGSNQTMTAALLANTTIESSYGVSQWPLPFGKTTAQTSAYGAFAGYNSQWDDVVLGVEMSYMHGSFGGTSSASMSRAFNSPVNGFYHAVTSTATSSISISDMATIRGRAGYAMGSFLPYAFFGLALGKADITRGVSVDDNYATTYAVAVSPCNSATPPFCATLSASEGQHNRLIYGYSAGLGVDVNLIAGLFARFEYEYVRFTTTVDTNINTVRAGLGYKF
ncbi:MULTISPECIES: outer membrane protein [unclassified Bradyrhizobium]|uniref:outer membrane protein n=1 Tax=unclassified Bradyrhizobium TaxID=2631580 RepID=UPI0028E1BDAF|nr:MULTISPECIES: outer membrane beta-barrel protein [unclassified Bradyrhizobium]